MRNGNIGHGACVDGTEATISVSNNMHGETKGHRFRSDVKKALSARFGVGSRILLLFLLLLLFCRLLANTSNHHHWHMLYAKLCSAAFRVFFYFSCLMLQVVFSGIAFVYSQVVLFPFRAHSPIESRFV